MSRLWLLLSLHCLSFIESKQALKISQQVFSARLSPHPSFASHAQKIKWLVLSFCFPYGIIIIRGKHWNRQGIVLWAYPRYQRVNGGAAVYQTANAERQTTTRTHSCYRCTVFRSHRVRLWQCSSCSSSHRGTYWSCCWVLHPRPLLTISQYLIRTLQTVPGDTACMDTPSWGRWTSCAACRSREKQQQKAKLEKNHSEGLTWGQWSVDTTC